MASTPETTNGAGRLLWLAFAAVVSSFFLTTFIVQRASTSVSTLSESIIANSGPSIEHLASVRRAVLEAELNLSRFVYEPQRRLGVGVSLDAEMARIQE